MSAAAETAAAEAAITEQEIAYTPVTLEPYTRVTEEPVYEGFSAGVYNLVNCFDCPRTTRLFAWTALRSFVGEQAMALQYRAVGNEAWAEVPAVERYQTDDRGEVFGHERYFAADVTGLTPDTAYEYRVAIVGEGAPVGEWHAFRTAPEEIGDFRFVAVGDTQGHNWDWNSYCKAAVDKAFSQVPDAAFLFNLGDMADAGFSLELWNLYFKAVGEHTATRPHFAVVGNHDTLVRDGEHSSRFGLHFHHPQNGAGALDMSFEQEAFYDSLKSQFKHPEEAIYSFDYGNAHFTVLHTGSYCPRDRAILEAQRAWLAADLEAHKDAKWKILCFHEPVYHRRGDCESRPWLFDTIEQYGVDLVLLGHSHLVTRTYPMKDGQIATKTSPDSIRKGTGTVHVTVGSTTLSHDDMGDPNMEYCMLIHTPPNEQAAYTTVSVKEDRIEVVIKQLDGYVVDEFVIEE
jgi:predicted MPP superfamily phosphohydrolase